MVYQHVHSQAAIWWNKNGVESRVDVRKDVVILAGAAGAALGVLDEVLRVLIKYCVTLGNELLMSAQVALSSIKPP